MADGDVSAYETSEQIWHLRMAGFSFAEIAQRLDFSTNDVHRLYRAFVMHLAADVSLDRREQIVQLELQRLDMMQRQHFMMSMAGDPKHTEAVLKIMAHRMKLLQLDAHDPRETAGQVLLISGDRETYIEALKAGRELPGRPDPDDGEDGETDEES